MRIRLAVPDVLDDHDRKDALDAALEAVTRTVAALVRTGKAPPAAGQIKSGRVRWHPEPPGDEHFDLPSTIMARGHGDCDDLAPWHAGSLRAAGIDPKARAIVRKSGPKRWHAIVQRGNGSIEDPSAHAGMHSVGGGTIGAGPAIGLPMSGDGRLCLAICPTRDARHPLIWHARCEVPDMHEPWAWRMSSAHPNPARALLRAVSSSQQVVGDSMNEDDALRLSALTDLISGANPDDIADALGEILGDDELAGEILGDAEQSVGFFGNVFRDVSRAVSHPLRTYRSIPGASQVLRTALPLAAGAFGGPAGAMAAQQLAQYIPESRQVRALDYLQAASAFAPGMGPPGGAAGGLASLLARGGGGGGGGYGGGGGGADYGGALAQLAQLFARQAQQQAPAFPQLARLAASIPGASYGFDRGAMARPWGQLGPSVMRF